MLKKSHWSWYFSILLILILFLNGQCLANSTLKQTRGNNDTPDGPLNIYYLSISKFLSPTPPAKSNSNKTELTVSQPLIFTHNVRDRKFDDQITPELNLWLDSRNKKGLEIKFELGFQAWEDDTLIKDKFYKILFKNYTTIGATGGENVRLHYLKYDGETFDIKYGTNNFCSIYFMINLTDNPTPSSSVDIYCGAWGKTSYIKLPYNQTLSAYEFEKEKNEKTQPTPGFLVELFFAALIATMAIYTLFQKSQKKR